MESRRALIIDAALFLATSAIGVVAVASVLGGSPRLVPIVAVAGLVVIAAGSVVARVLTRPDHIRAMQSHQILEIASRTLAYMRRGLDPETAQAVCRLALEQSDAAAVAITDRETVLGFAGLGEDHHHPGGPIMTKATREAIESDEHRILATREDIGCPVKGCYLRAAIVVPLHVRGEVVGTLKFYYTTPRLLNETQVTMVEGLAHLLSTQLELSELERQTELACRMELKALQAQISPHFLFNTINTIAALIRTDPAQARELLREFARFYRRTLEENEDLVPLERELEYARSYMRFEQARFGDRIRMVEEIDEELEGVMVPAFIIQPLVENCVQHALLPDRPLTIRLRVGRDEDGLAITVQDDGAGIPADELPRVLETGVGRGLGIALKNVHDRVRGHFGPGSGLTIESREGVGTTVTARLVPRSGG
ncbi:histidine kinase [Coriobacteriia bacterium Es71-Z0120]|uniref:histidine kinase n=1 Tax=Parvivirga hydrogeniphila TaxID=2939460 RepID=UPI00226100E9|nr:histidine kinase [Parvivirga hydrogeniphila]MCL4078344.1 histidine kinase [Parvivirga hydrogeniphila]